MNIVGLGAVSALGVGREHFYGLATQKAESPIPFCNSGFLSDTVFYQGVLSDDEARSAHFLAKTAIQEALSSTLSKFRNVALVVATGAGDTASFESGNTAPGHSYDLAEELARHFGFSGRFVSVSNACASAGYAIPVAKRLLDTGSDAVVLCGVEAKSSTSQAAFKAMMALDPVSCRPFHVERAGTVLGAGAAALLLTAKNDVPGYAWLLANAINCDGYHATAPQPEGLLVSRCLDQLLTESGLSTDQIDYFVPHATGTQLNDAIEMGLLSRVFPETFNDSCILLLKKWIGHTGGASAAFSYLCAALQLHNRNPVSLSTTSRYALVSSTAFGGHNCFTLLANSKVGVVK